LIVDDEPVTRILLRRRLSRVGCEIVGEAETAADALEKLPLVKPDLITLDILMPDLGELDAFLLSQRIRREHPGIESVIISGAPQATLDRFRGKSTVGIFAKPVSFHALFSKLRQFYPELKADQPESAF
jgi:CheY-like chemotaxis protein